MGITNKPSILLVYLPSLIAMLHSQNYLVFILFILAYLSKTGLLTTISLSEKLSAIKVYILNDTITCHSFYSAFSFFSAKFGNYLDEMWEESAGSLNYNNSINENNHYMICF